MKYEVVIPAYNCASQLDTIITDIIAVTNRYKPERIIIADDCSTDEATKYKARFYSSKQLPVVNYSLTEHKGTFYAEQLGLSKVQTPLAIVCHADVKLRGEKVPTKIPHADGTIIKIKLWEDTLSVLINHLNKTEDAVGVSCLAVSPKHKTHYVSNSRRGIGDNGIPYGIQRKSKLLAMLKMWIYEWHEVYSFDTQLFAIRMNYYNEVQYDEQFAPYYLYHDDFFARAREKGYRVYMTQNCICYHAVNKPKPDDSLSRLTPELIDNHHKLFKERWNDSDMWEPTSLKAKQKVQQVLQGGARR